MANHKHDREATHFVARWVRQPEAFAVTATVLGLALLWASLQLPVSLTAVAVALGGAVGVVAGALTGLVMIAGRALGLNARSQRAVTEGRKSILLPGPGGSAKPVSAPAAAEAPEAAQEHGGSTAVREPGGVSEDTQPIQPHAAPAEEETVIVLPDARRPVAADTGSPVTLSATGS